MVEENKGKTNYHASLEKEHNKIYFHNPNIQ